ncbi:MAG: OsmC family protein [Maritimibacter sp.]|nr:OsmC family protein [Maritimibacter sp.]
MTYQPEFPTTAAAADARIQSAQRAVIERIAAAPEKARSTIRTTGEIGEGLSCRVRQGKFEAVTDLSLGMGGDCTGPSPGFFARVGIVGCVGIAVKMLAAREGLAFEAVHVTVETDFDDAALFGIGDGNAAPTETRVVIDIVTEADAAAVDALVARALAMDPWLLALRDPQRVVTSVAVATPPR